MTMAVLLFPDESYKIVGACFAVYNDKGCGFLEPVYQECLAIEFRHLQIPAVAKPELVLSYRGQTSNTLTDPTSFATERSSWNSRQLASSLTSIALRC